MLQPGQRVTLLLFGVPWSNYLLKTEQSFNLDDILIDPFGRQGVHVDCSHPFGQYARTGFYGFKIQHENNPGLLLAHHSQINIKL